MNNARIKDYLVNNYAKLKNPQYAVLLEGEWGCGKTFFVKDVIQSIKVKNNPDDKRVHIDAIYVSLNGLKSIGQINEKIRKEIFPLISKKGVQTIVNLVKGCSQLVFKSVGIKEDIVLVVEFDLLDLLSIADQKSVNGSKVFFFDDFERCEIPIKELLGYINMLVEHKACKVVIITYESKISNDQVYKEYKEKIIGRSFIVESEIKSALYSFIGEIETITINPLIKSNEGIIREIYEASNVKNLRTLRRAILELEQFLLCIPAEFKEKVNYDKCIQHLVAYFVIIYIEYLNGTIDECYNVDISIEKNDPLIKYKAIQGKRKMYSLSCVYSLSHLLQFIKEGKVAKDDVRQILSQNIFFKDESLNDVQKLASWVEWSGSQKDFEELVERVWSCYQKREIQAIGDIITTARLFKILNDEGITSKDPKEIRLIMKSELEKKFSNDPDIIKSISLLGYNTLDSKRCESDEFSSDIKSVIDKICNQQLEKRVKDFFEDLNEFNFEDIYLLMDESVPNGYCVYKLTAFLSLVDPQLFGKKVLTFSANGVSKICDFFQFRYEGYASIEPYIQSELGFLTELLAYLENHQISYKGPQKYQVDTFMKYLRRVIKRIHFRADI